MLISFSVQVPPAATLFLFGFGIDHPCARRRIKLEVWTPHVTNHNRILQDLLFLMVSPFFVLLNTGHDEQTAQLAPLQWVILCAHDWNVNLQHIWSIFLWRRIRQRNAPEKNGRRKFGRTIYSIFGTIPSLSHSWCWYLMPLPSPWNGYDHQIPQIPFVPVQTSDCNNHYGVTNATHQQLLKREDKNLNIKGKVIRVWSAEQPWVLRRLTANKSVNCS